MDIILDDVESTLHCARGGYALQQILERGKDDHRGRIAQALVAYSRVTRIGEQERALLLEASLYAAPRVKLLLARAAVGASAVLPIKTVAPCRSDAGIARAPLHPVVDLGSGAGMFRRRFGAGGVH